jgi:hypothetical protein
VVAWICTCTHFIGGYLVQLIKFSRLPIIESCFENKFKYPEETYIVAEYCMPSSLQVVTAPKSQADTHSYLLVRFHESASLPYTNPDKYSLRGTRSLGTLRSYIDCLPISAAAYHTMEAGQRRVNYCPGEIRSRKLEST